LFYYPGDFFFTSHPGLLSMYYFFSRDDYYLFEIKYLFLLVCVPILDYFFSFFDRK